MLRYLADDAERLLRLALDEPGSLRSHIAAALVCALPPCRQQAIEKLSSKLQMPGTLSSS
jgi:hypothetical protein